VLVNASSSEDLGSGGKIIIPYKIGSRVIGTMNIVVVEDKAVVVTASWCRWDIA
jgi:hypothetical protein